MAVGPPGTPETTQVVGWALDYFAKPTGDVIYLVHAHSDAETPVGRLVDAEVSHPTLEACVDFGVVMSIDDGILINVHVGAIASSAHSPLRRRDYRSF